MLGAVDVSSLFLQQVVDEFSTTIHFRRDIKAQMSNQRCPTGSSKCILLFVARYLHRITMLHSSRRDQGAFRLNKTHPRNINSP
jgi:hypothetical protein